MAESAFQKLDFNHASDNVQVRPDSARPDVGSATTFTDRLRLILEKASEADAKLFIELKYAVCLKALSMTATEFNQLHLGSASITTKILGPQHKKSPISNSVLVVYAHVPGLTDLLPEPDLNAIIRYNKVTSDLTNKNEDARKEAKKLYTKDLPKITEEYRKQAEIITMFPRFYSAKLDAPPSPGQICDIKYFINSDSDRQRPLPTLMFGELIGVHNQTIIEKNEN
jgi:hypothetical protein